MKSKLFKSTVMRHVAVATIGVAALAQTTVSAQTTFPDKSVVAIVPFGAGGGNDILLRLLAKHAGEFMGQTLVVENKPGAGGQIGWTTLAKARPDGYTIGATSLPSMVLIKAMRPNTPFELSDFTYVCNIQVDPVIWVVNADSPYKTAQDFVEAANKADKPLNVAGDGPQSNIQLQHLAATSALGVQTNFVPFSGSNAALTALLGGKVDLGVATLSAAQNNLDSGKLRALTVFSETPVSSIADVPVAKAALGKEIGPVGMAMRGIAAPRDVPAERIQKLEDICQQTVQSPAFLEEANRLGLMIQYMDSKQAGAAVQASAQAIETLKDLLK